MMTTKTLSVYDPAMCCSTGICGSDVDPQLARFSSDLEWLRAQGVKVERFNLAQEPGAFADDTSVKGVLENKGEAGLPLIKVGDTIVSSGTYPSRDELAAWTNQDVAAPTMKKKKKKNGEGAAAEPSATTPKKASCSGSCDSARPPLVTKKNSSCC